MRWLSRLNKPSKTFIIVMTFLMLMFIVLVLYFGVTNNSMFATMSRYFVGDTESEIVIDEVIPYKRQEIKDKNLDIGITETRQKGVDGKKKIVFRVTRDKDGNEINREYAGEEMVTNAVDEIVAIGTRTMPVAASSNGQADNSNISPNYYGQNGQPSNTANNGQQNQASGNVSSGDNGQGQSTGASSAIHYCTVSEPGWGGREWRRFYIKTSQPCGQTKTKWDNHTIEVSSNEFYSHELYMTSSGPDVVQEIRYEKCGNDLTAGPDAVCRKY